MEQANYYNISKVQPEHIFSTFQHQCSGPRGFQLLTAIASNFAKNLALQHFGFDLASVFGFDLGALWVSPEFQGTS